MSAIFISDICVNAKHLTPICNTNLIKVKKSVGHAPLGDSIPVNINYFSSCLAQVIFSLKKKWIAHFSGSLEHFRIGTKKLNVKSMMQT